MARPSKKDYLLRVIRESKGISKERIADKLGLPANNVWRAEVGKILSESIALKIACELGVDPDIMFYNMGRIPPDKREFIMKDPLFFKELIDEICSEPWKLTKTKEYMDSIKEKMKVVNPDINKILAKIKPSE
jgi:transcriptional regulator with XRE-family HTH domain